MIKSKLAALCLISVSVTLYAGSPADAWVLFPAIAMPRLEVRYYPGTNQSVDP